MEYKVIPIKDNSTILRAFYISVLTEESNDKILSNINKIYDFLKKINDSIVLKNLEIINMRYYFLFKI